MALKSSADNRRGRTVEAEQPKKRLHPQVDVLFRAFLLLLFELNHVIPDAECTEAADKAGNAAETILLHVKGRVCLFQLIVYDAQIIHMSVISLDDADDFLFNLSLGDAGALFLDKITAVELDHLKVVVVQAFQKGGELGVAVVPDIKI